MATEVDLNRWREAGKEIGRKIGVVEERERIIKLLEAECCEMKNYQQSMGIHWALALIKGENK